MVSATQALAGLRVVVTGAGGMVGSAVAAQLVAQGARLHAHLGPPGATAVPAPAGVRTAVADIADSKAVARLLRGADAVVHLAGPASVAASFAEPVTYTRSHVLGTAAVLEGCRSAAVRQLVYLSSAEVYGQPARNPVTEDAPTLPGSPYGAAKLGAEALVRAFCPPAGIGAVVLRPFSAYGPRSPAHSLVGTLLRQALHADRLSVATLRPVRDYVHVDDVATAVALALPMTATTAQPRVYNVAGGTGTSVAALANLVVATAGRSVDIIETAPGDRPVDVAELVGDTRRARDELGWAPAIALPDGIAAALLAVRGRR